MFIISYISTMPLIIHVFYEILNFFWKFWFFFLILKFYENLEFCWEFVKNLKFWNIFEKFRNVMKFWNFWNFLFWIFEFFLWNLGKFWNFLGIRYRVCDIGYTRYRLGTIIDNAYTKHLYFNLNIWYNVVAYNLVGVYQWSLVYKIFN